LLPAGTHIPAGLVLTDPGGANGLGIADDTELELIAAGVRDGRYRYHPLTKDGLVATYPYLYFFAEDGSWNLRTESGTASGGTIATTSGGALPDVAGGWTSYYGALNEPHPIITRHTPAFTVVTAESSGDLDPAVNSVVIGAVCTHQASTCSTELIETFSRCVRKSPADPTAIGPAQAQGI